MNNMNFYGNEPKVQITEEYYKKLLKYKDNYFLLWQTLTEFFEFRSDGSVYSVNTDALADFLVPYVEQYVKTCGNKP